MSVAQKTAFIQVAQNCAAQLAVLRWTMHIYHLLYNARHWEPSGSDEITDAEAAPMNVTAAQIHEFVETVEEGLDKMMTNQAVTAFDAEARVNAMRNDM